MLLFFHKRCVYGTKDNHCIMPVMKTGSENFFIPFSKRANYKHYMKASIAKLVICLGVMRFCACL